MYLSPVAPLHDQAVAIGSPSPRGAVREGRAPALHRVGHWELIALAAEGRWSQVYRARPADGPADRPAAYAMKLLRPELEHDEQANALLAREVLVGRSVSHPHLIPVLGANLHALPRWLVMPWLDGTTLRDRLQAGRGLDVAEALWIARQVAEALAAIHVAGWFHGDVKPSNIFVSSEGHVTLLDLGFARRGNEAGKSIDRAIMGTVGYLAPECITSTLRPDIRSDIYSLGAVLFEVFAGRLPFEARDLVELATQHRQQSVPNLRRLAAHLPHPVARLVQEMLAKAALRRPQTPQELADRLATLEIATFAERAAL